MRWHQGGPSVSRLRCFFDTPRTPPQPVCPEQVSASETLAILPGENDPALELLICDCPGVSPSSLVLLIVHAFLGSRIRVPATRIPSRVAAPARTKLIAVPCLKRTSLQGPPPGAQAPSSRFSVGVGCGAPPAATARPIQVTIHGRN